MTVSVLGALPIGGINLAASAAVGLVGPLFAEIDAALFGTFGLGSLSADISLQFQAALDAEVTLGLQISDPFASIEALANLLASLSISLPTVSLEVGAALSANAALAAALGLRMGGITALIEAVLAVKLPAVEFFAGLAASLSAGPVFLLSFENGALSGGLAGAGAQIAANFSAGLVSGPSPIAPGEPVFGVVLLTKEPSVFASLGAVLKVA